MFSSLEYQLCDMQGCLFELSLESGYDSKLFIEAFMNSQAAASLDDTYDRLQWLGEAYILEELDEEVGGLKVSSNLYDKEVMFWAGYLYRYWHYYTGEFSRDIYKIADAEMINDCWLGFRTLDPRKAIDNFKEIYEEKNHI